MTSSMRSTSRAFILAGMGAAILWQPLGAAGQGTVDPRLSPGPSGTVEQGTTDTGPTGTGPTDTGPKIQTPRTDQAIAEQQRLSEQERRAIRYREEHRHHGETYVAGFGGVTFGSTTRNMEGRGSALGAQIDSPTLSDSAVYGVKFGYFHPGRLNWLGVEVEAFNTNPHIQQSGNLLGTHLRLTTLAFNLIARTKLGCRDRRDGQRADSRDAASRDAAYWDADDYSALRDNARCPMQLYAGAGLGVFFAETSNQFGRATDNARAGLNALAGAKYFFNEHLALFAEYKFNYVDLRFDQNQVVGGATGGLNGTYLINHVVGGLAFHF